MLGQMFRMQENLQSLVGSDVDSQEYKNQMALALVCEMVEALGETPWKPWKKQQEFNEERYKEELIDCWAFLINMTFPVMNCKELFDKFTEKNNINLKRQANGY